MGTRRRREERATSNDEMDGPIAGLANESVVIPFSTKGIRGVVIDIPVVADALPASVTTSEREVLALVLAGLSSQQIADARKRSYRTVANQLAAVYRKLQVAGRAEFVARYGPSLGLARAD